MLNPASLLTTALLVCRVSAAYAQQQIAPSESDTDNNSIVEAVSDTVLVAAPPGSCVPAPPGLVSWWRGENVTVDDWASNDGPPGGRFVPFPPPIVPYSIGKVGRCFASSFTVE